MAGRATLAAHCDFAFNWYYPVLNAVT